MKNLTSKVIAVLLFTSACFSATANIIVFENTPNDPTGQVFTTNANDDWDIGRGMQFSVSSTTIIDSFGVLQDLSLNNGISMNYEIFDITNNSVMQSGNTGVVGTNGLEFIDVFFSPVQFQIGNLYHMEFDFNGLSNQNFFHVEAGGFGGNPGYLAEDSFININSTAGGVTATDNFVIAKFRVNVVEDVEPVNTPAPLAILLLGALTLGVRKYLS
jgi:hypothetical protein